MWANARLEKVTAYRLVVLTAPPEWGTQRLLAALKESVSPLVILRFDEAVQEDPVAQSLVFSEGVAAALGASLITHGLPYSVGLRLVDAFREVYGAMTYLVVGAEHAPELTRALAASEAQRVVALCDVVPEGWQDALVLDEAALRLSEEEALALCGDALPEAQTLALLEESGGAFEPFYSALHSLQGLPLPLMPTLDGLRLPPGQELAVAPAELLEVLLERGEWDRALVLAVRHLPGRVSEILKEAGPHYRARGLQGRLWKLLQEVPGELDDERLLFWRLSAAVRLNVQEGLRARIEGLLEKQEAPELRALYAGIFLPPDAALNELRRAALFETPLTLHMLGVYEPEGERGCGLLKRALRLAERLGRPDEAVRNAGALAARLLDTGHYREALHWGEWALELYDRNDLRDLTRRAYLVNDCAFVRLLTGDITGLGTLLAETERLLAGVFGGAADLLRSTLGDYYVALGESERALPLYRLLYDKAPRERLGFYGRPLVRALLELGETREAERIAERGVVLTEGAESVYRLPALLAQGMVLAVTAPGRALTLLESLLREPLPAWLEAQARLWRSLALLELDEEARARAELAHPSLADLGEAGLRLLAGPEARFRELFDAVLGEVDLELRLLGRREVWFEGRPLELPFQSLELLAILARHPLGISPERLALSLYGERGGTNALYGAVKKLRQWLPVEGTPYRLGVGVRADFLELDDLLLQGRLKEAVLRYRGPLLHESEAPALQSLREALEARLREAVLSSEDADAVAAFAELAEDDLELWEKLGALLPAADPRAMLARFKAGRLSAEYG